MSDVVDWLLDPGRSDPSLRWQVMRDLLDAPASVWGPERARVATTGWGAQLLAAQDADGQWAGGAVFPGDFDWDADWQQQGQPWTATLPTLWQLRELGVDPTDERMQRTAELVGAHCRFEHDDEPFWEGEVEPCINGRVVGLGAWLGVDVDPLVARLAAERLADGGWNCEAERGSVRSSFDTTINVVEGLLEHERATGGTEASRDARRSGEEYLLRRRLFRRLSTGEPIARYLHLLHPNRWHHDVLRGLDHVRAASVLTGAPPDPRLDEAIAFVRSRRRDDGTWPLDRDPPGSRWVDVDDGEDAPSRWITLRALRVLRWWEG
jgi:hypothetical protein